MAEAMSEWKMRTWLPIQRATSTLSKINLKKLVNLLFLVLTESNWKGWLMKNYLLLNREIRPQVNWSHYLLQSIYQYNTRKGTNRLSLFFFFFFCSRLPGKGQRFGILQLLKAQTLDVSDPLTTRLRLYPPHQKDVFYPRAILKATRNPDVNIITQTKKDPEEAWQGMGRETPKAQTELENFHRFFFFFPHSCFPILSGPSLHAIQWHCLTKCSSPLSGAVALRKQGQGHCFPSLPTPTPAPHTLSSSTWPLRHCSGQFGGLRPKELESVPGW